MEKFPDVLLKLPNLKSLIIKNCGFDEIPDEIKNMPSGELDISHFSVIQYRDNKVFYWLNKFFLKNN